MVVGKNGGAAVAEVGNLEITSCDIDEFLFLGPYPN